MNLEELLKDLEECQLLAASISRMYDGDGDHTEAKGLADMIWDRVVGMQHDARVVLQGRTELVPAAEVRQ